VARPRPTRPFNRNHFHYNWHWHWAYGNGDTGNQGPHQFDIARWGLNKNEHPVKLSSTGGYFGPPASQETPDTHTTHFEYADGTLFEFATRGQFTNDEGTQRIGNLFYGTKGWLWIDGDGRTWQSYLGPKNEKGPGSEAPPRAGRQRPERPHQPGGGALPELRRRDPRERPEAAHLRGEDGHLSSALAHLANIAYRVGRQLRFDGKAEKFVGDAEADGCSRASTAPRTSSRTRCSGEPAAGAADPRTGGRPRSPGPTG
jgi:predicted dehydrogenase